MPVPYQTNLFPVMAADDSHQHNPIMRSRVRIKKPSFGFAWLGVGVLFAIAGLAVTSGRRHETEVAKRSLKSH